jgi:thioredoxin-like negative regulator of GroEL
VQKNDLAREGFNRLSLATFSKEISKDSFTYVVFTIKNCKPCRLVKEAIQQVKSDFPDVTFWQFYVRALNTKEFEKQHNINLVPQTIVFKKGQEVSRHLGLMNKKTLTKYLTSVMNGN